MQIRPMTAGDLDAVTQLGIQSKASWGYSAAMMEIFAAELNVDLAAVQQLLAARVAHQNEQVVGYYTLRRHNHESVDLEHLFVRPDHFGQGIGSELLRDAMSTARNLEVGRLRVISDPHASGFYEKHGARHIGNYQSDIPGRVLPIYELIF